MMMALPSERLFLVTAPEHDPTVYVSRRGKLHGGRASQVWNAWRAFKAANGVPNSPLRVHALDAAAERGDRLADFRAEADDRPELADAEPPTWHIFTAPADTAPPAPPPLHAAAVSPLAPRAPATA